MDLYKLRPKGLYLRSHYSPLWETLKKYGLTMKVTAADQARGTTTHILVGSNEYDKVALIACELVMKTSEGTGSLHPDDFTIQWDSALAHKNNGTVLRTAAMAIIAHDGRETVVKNALDGVTLLGMDGTCRPVTYNLQLVKVGGGKQEDAAYIKAVAE